MIVTTEDERELDRREANGIEVALLWRMADDQLRVAVVDSRTGEEFELWVEPRHALDAFHHPYAWVDRALAAGPGETGVRS